MPDVSSPNTRHYSLEPPCGLPSPFHNDATQSPSGDLYSDGEEPNTLISSMSHLSVSCLPYPDTPEQRGRNLKHQHSQRFPDLPPPRLSSPLASRTEQRKIYLGPKLSDRATGGPDAGPLIERFSCLFKDRKSLSEVWVRELMRQSITARPILEVLYPCESHQVYAWTRLIDRGVAENFLMEKECLEVSSSCTIWFQLRDSTLQRP